MYNHYSGNSKFASISFDTTDPGRWMVQFDLVVDGEKVWDYEWTYERELPPPKPESSWGVWR